MKICLTFDIEEFDRPRVDYHVPLGLDRQLEISRQGTVRLLDTLHGLGVRATFFTTAVFAQAYPGLVRRIVSEGHELASHSFAHGKFQKGDYARSKQALEALSGVVVNGYRSPRMAGVDTQELAAAGYQYDSSINPSRLPGYRNKPQAPRTIHRAGPMVEIPVSVTPRLRLPLFWLSMHWLPIELYRWLCVHTARRDGYLNLCFHPWEFCEQMYNKELRIPFYIRKNSGEPLVRRLAGLLAHFKDRGAEFATLGQLVDEFLNNKK